jgi:phosphoglycolate phosphatase-like HAD superfamily hydrolase
MHYQNILFDLDGTLTDPREGITRSIQYAPAQLGIDEPDLRRLEHFIGPPLLLRVELRLRRGAGLGGGGALPGAFQGHRVV